MIIHGDCIEVMAGTDPESVDDPTDCPPSKRADGKHSWVFDGDDPYIVCTYCGELRDAVHGRLVRRGVVVCP